MAKRTKTKTGQVSITTKPACYMGVDPGKSGAACLLFSKEHVLFFDWPKDDNVFDVFCQIKLWNSDYNICSCILEKVSSMPKQGVKSMFTFGRNYGMWETVIAVNTIPYILYTPQAWRKGLVTKSDGKDTKQAVRNVARKLFPSLVNELQGPKGGWKDGRADALLMAFKAKQMNL